MFVPNLGWRWITVYFAYCGYTPAKDDPRWEKMQSIEVRDELVSVISCNLIMISEIWIFVLRNLDVSMFLKPR